MPHRPMTLPAPGPPSPLDHSRGLVAVIKEHPIVVVMSLALGIVATVVPVSISIMEKWNETTGTIDIESFDQNKSFLAPLVIKNASTLFEIHSTSAACRLFAAYDNGTTPQMTENGSTAGWHALPTKTVEVKSSAIFFCDFPDKLKYANAAGEDLTLNRRPWRYRQNIKSSFCSGLLSGSRSRRPSPC